jgi:prepilin-type N-terminal cleavage/methylation domain-containing protein
MSRRVSRGFTLIELLVVIAITVILAAILFPTIDGNPDGGPWNTTAVFGGTIIAHVIIVPATAGQADALRIN